jgi:hypothetical protein
MDLNEQQRIQEMEAQELAGRDEELLLQQSLEAEEQRQIQQNEFAAQQQEQQQQQIATPQQTQPKPEPQPEPEPQPKQDSEPMQAVETSPFRSEDGTVDMEKIEAYGGEFDRATLTSISDFAVDSINFVAGWFGFDQPVPKVPKFESELAQASREIQSVMIPMVAGNAAALKGIQAIPAVKNTAFLQTNAARVVGSKFLEAGVGATVGAISATSKEENASGTLKQSFPRTFGWLPDWLATNEYDSPDDKWRKNIVEGTIFDSTLGMFESAFALTRKSARNAQVMNWVPQDEKATKYFDTNLQQATPEEARSYFMDLEMEGAPLDEAWDSMYAAADKKWKKLSRKEKRKYRILANNNDPEVALNRSYEAQESALDELGQYNLSKSANLDEPMLGVHDLYGYRESGIRQVDDLGVVAASVDAARIQGNIDTINGRLSSMISDGAMKQVIDTGAYDDVSLGLAQELSNASSYHYVTNTGKEIPFERIQAAGDLLATKLYNTSPEDMATMLEPFLSKPSKQGVRALNTEGGKAVASVMKRYYDDMLNPDYLRAQGLLSTSLSGQVADTSMSVRLMDGTEALERGAEQVLDRLEYLMNLKAGTDFSKANAINLGNIWKQLNTWGPQANTNKQMRKALRQWEDTRVVGDEAMAQIRQQTARTISTMRAISKEQPALMGPFLFAYEMTDGALDSMHSLNRFYNNSTGVWKKAFIDGASDVPSIYNKAWWSNVYNNALSALGTPIKAVLSGGVLLLNRPVAEGIGVASTVDQRAMRRGWYMYSSMLDTLGNGVDYMKKVWRKAGTDPYMAGQRENFNNQDQVQIDIVKRIAAAKAAQGEPAAQIFVDQLQEMLDVANDPTLRFGTRAMSAFDGFIQAVVGSWEARGRAFTQLTGDGAEALKADQLDELSKNIYNQMFDESGLMTDEAVKIAAGEISFNLDSGFNDGLNNLLDRVPVAKPFFMFTKTPLTAMAFTASANPLGLAFKNMNKFALPYDKMDGARVQQLLQERGIKFNQSTVRDEYTRIRNEMNGRKAIGTITMTLAAGMFMNDRLRGDGLYDQQAQAARRDFDYEPRTYQGWDGNWYSYAGLGPISDYIALTANIMDNGLFWAGGKAAVREQTLAEHIRAMGFVLSASVTDHTYLANLEPMMDILRGDPSAMQRWAGSFLPSATIPGANAVAQFSKMLDETKKVVETSWLDIAASRTPLKMAMPTRSDWVDGGPVGEPPDFWTRVWNASGVFKNNGKTSEVKEFLTAVGFDARPSLTSNGKGVEYSIDQQAEILDSIGARGYFKAEVLKIMKEVGSAEQWKQELRKAQQENLDANPDNFGNLHNRLRKALNQAVTIAQNELSSRNDVQQQQGLNKEQRTLLQRGDVDAAIKLRNYANGNN